MLAVFDNDSIPAKLVQRRLRWLGHAAKLSGSELIKDLLLQPPPYTWRRPTEDVGNHVQGRPGAPLHAESLRVHTTEKGLGESF